MMCHGVSLVETVAVGGIFLRQCCVYEQFPDQTNSDAPTISSGRISYLGGNEGLAGRQSSHYGQGNRAADLRWPSGETSTCDWMPVGWENGGWKLFKTGAFGNLVDVLFSGKGWKDDA